MSLSISESLAETPKFDQAGANGRRLRLYFAILSCLGGLVLASGEGAEHIAVIAVFFACFGYVFVDRLELFALPPIAAYVLMGAAAVYCVGDFWNMDTPGNQQMLSVALLLVLVQAVLMLQQKTPRIFEQLGVFCLLELVVAAVFNDAFVYGLLLLPIGLIGVWALALLASVTTCEALDPKLENAEPGMAAHSGHLRDSSRWLSGSALGRQSQSPAIRSSSAESTGSLAEATAWMGRYAVITLAPAIVLVAAVFFYAIPRTTDAARMEGRGQVLIGFDDKMRLDQIGQMLRSSDPALRIRLSDRRTKRPYMVSDGIYLRGQVLERYEPMIGLKKVTATWKSASAGARSRRLPLPNEFLPTRLSDKNFYDSVDVDVTCASMDSPALFTIAPHFRTKSESGILHSGSRFLLFRPENSDFVYPRIRYHFGTNGFRDGVQTDMLAEMDAGPTALSAAAAARTADPQASDPQASDPQASDPQASDPQASDPQASDQQASDQQASDQRTTSDFGGYRQRVLLFNPVSMPTVARLAGQIRDSIPLTERTDFKVAKAMEQHLAVDGGYDYTLDLSAESVPGMDPVEQFISIDRTGHCQYFAAALVMMLRSVNIPARVVVGYHTDNFSETGQYYLARQSDAHAWVEALFSQDQLGADRLVYGQPKSEQYWVRLDPTPGGGGASPTAARGVDQVLNLARDIWEEYVVDMDSDRQQRALSGGLGEETGYSYASFVGWMRQKVIAIRGGRLEVGSLALRDIFSWPLAILAVLIATVLFFLLRVRLPRWIRRRIDKKPALITGKPAVGFYADMLNQLERLGITRAAAQTPSEFLDDARMRLQHARSLQGGDIQIIDSLRYLTEEFCRQRYGDRQSVGADVEPALSKLRNHVDALLITPGRVLTQSPPQTMEQQP